MSEYYIDVNHVRKNYGGYQALTDVNLQLQGGRIVGLCGPNGSGKTTLIKIIVGLLRDFNGEVSVLGNPIGEKSKALVSYLPDVEFLQPSYTGFKAIREYSRMYSDFNAGRMEELFVRLKLEGDMPISRMSKGMREKFQLALCLSREAHIYILDEPIAGVDPAARDSIIETIINNYTNDALLVISTHLIADIENILDEVVFIRDGHVILHDNCDNLREERGTSIDEIFREEFRW